MKNYLLFFLIFPLFCFASHSPFGFEIGKMTLQEFREKNNCYLESKLERAESYLLDSIGLNNLKKEMSSYDTIQLNDLEKIYFVFHEEVLAHITFHFNFEKFDDLSKEFDSLSNALKAKYRCVGEKHKQFFAAKSVKFTNDDDVGILLTTYNFAPHTKDNVGKELSVRYFLLSFEDYMANLRESTPYFLFYGL